ncbi:C39 family peptidase [Dactylosporangium sp. CS-033363]|uniref:C39 family peptidase n=1 Tax=Dactylosporangium sp. CS-033363 TaxID=3239935 RepID=UPI003D8A5E94
MHQRFTALFHRPAHALREQALPGKALRRPVPAVLGAASLMVVSVATAALFNAGGKPAAEAHPVGTAALSTATPPAQPKQEAPAPDLLDTAPAANTVNFDFQFQPNFYYCGPASTRIALTSVGADLSQDDVARRLGTTVNGTNSVADVTRAMNGVLGKPVYEARFINGQKASAGEARQLQYDAVRALSTGRALVANIVGGATDESGTYHEFSGGHYISLVGYRDQGRSVLIADPSGMFGPRTYWMSTDSLANWAAKRGYVA